MLCGLLSYASVADQWRAGNGRSAEERKRRPADPPVLPAPRKAEDLPGLLPQKPQRHFRRGPPNLQIRAPGKGSEDRRQDDTKWRDEAVGDARREGSTRRTVVSWRGAVIEPQPGTELPSRKAEAPPRPSSQAPRIQNQAGKTPRAPCWASPGHSDEEGARTPSGGAPAVPPSAGPPRRPGRPPIS
uniref:Uncharacterized protein n=1 Tax=Mustela putorius furo TaxID=9669 RepID=M3XS36_MUSPF